jgi:N-methylhydantoinase A/oxoprolinase/acetone carboxylase beta subunit/N-methylhydantoinase B/oxoprolinase/acetone carboxylase alpha subunit
MAGLSVGIDIGGTFTDAVAYAADGHRFWATKVPSTPSKQAEAFMRALNKILGMASSAPRDIERIVHATTVATNCIIERKGATIGILTTEGFEDVLTIGTTLRSDMYNLFIDPQAPTFLCPRRRIFGIPERIGQDGEEITPLNEDRVRETVDILRNKYQVQGIVICYLFSFANPLHEIRTKEIINELYPELDVSLSSVVDPKFREFQRLCVTCFNAYVGPLTKVYFKDIEAKLKSSGVQPSLQIMQSRGAISSVATITERPVGTILSGPAAGVIGGKFTGQAAGFKDLITLDMGGTSCDIALVREGKSLISTEGKFENYPFRLPMIDVKTIGAGGGTIAWVDKVGRLGVGPQSAGAEPGPACYGLGGDDPTVTDASVVLGYLNPECFAGGEITLNLSLATKTIKEKIADPLFMDVPTAAAGIHRVVNSNMAQTLRLISLGRGYDPRDFTLVAMGGAGPVHCGPLAEELSIPQIVIPATPGVLSAFGLLMADTEHEFAKTYQVETGKTKPQELERIFDEMDEICMDKVRKDRIPESEVVISRFAEMRYVGQGYELEIPFPSGNIDKETVATMVEHFHDEHKRLYGHCTPEASVEFVNLRVVHLHSIPKPEVSTFEQTAATLEGAKKGTREAYFEEYHSYVETPVFAKGRLPVNQEIIGPAIIEQEDTTIVIYPGQRGCLDTHQNIIITTRGSSHGEEATKSKKRGVIANEEPIDPITLEVVRNRLDVIANEMQTAMLKSSYSIIVREASDASSALFDRRGYILAQAVAIPAHLGMMPTGMTRIMELFPLEQMNPGDSYIMNDPFEGGTHLPDITIITPIFFKQRVAAFSVIMCHHQDVGGKASGTPTDATEIYAEGIIIPPMKFYDKGKPNETLIKMLKRNVRTPDLLMGDLRAQIAAAYTAQQRMTELFEEYGEDTIYRCIDQLMNQSEQLTRLKIEEIPAGRYTFYDFIDEDGVNHDKPIRLEVTVEVKGSDLYIDWEGTSPQTKGPINCVVSSSLAPCYYVVRAITDPTIPNNEGCYRMVHVNLPRGSLVNANPPGACGLRATTFIRMTDVLFGALIQAVPNRIGACSSGDENVHYVSGFDPKVGKIYTTVLAQPLMGGMGARPNKDGIDVICTDLINCTLPSIEASELAFPLRYLRCNLWQDSGGAGKNRGGLGFEAICLWLRGESHMCHRSDRVHFAPWGVFGGQAGAKHRSIIVRKDGKQEILPSNLDVTMRAGDQLHVFVAGGGGYGDPFERDPEKVLEDVLDRRVSLEAAREKYGVVIDTATMTIDLQATQELRQPQRRANGKPSRIFDRGPEYHEKN